jgi:hypothetical protein
MLAAIGLWAAVADTNQVLSRYEAWRRANPDYACRVIYSDGRGTTLPGELRREGRKRMYFEIGPATRRYTIAITEQGRREVDTAQRMYDELPGEEVLVIIESRLSGALENLFPGIVMAERIGGTEESSRPKFIGRVREGGIEVDRLEMVVEGPMGSGTYRMDFDPEGRLRSFSEVQQTNAGQRRLRGWTFSDYRRLRSGANEFALAIPDGFTPLSTVHTWNPIAIGTKLNLGVWRTGNATVDLGARTASGKWLIAYLGSGCAPSARAEASLRKLEAAGVKVQRVSDAKTAASSQGRAFEPTGRFLKQANPPATPFFIALDNGTVKGMWQGFAPRAAASLEADVKATFAGR